MDKPDNPPAFPQSEWSLQGGDGREGMTLRDWFAVEAPPVPWNFEQPAYVDPSTITDWSTEAVNARAHEEMMRDLRRDVKWRLFWADAMLAARTTPKEPQP